MLKRTVIATVGMFIILTLLLVYVERRMTLDKERTDQVNRHRAQEDVLSRSKDSTTALNDKSDTSVVLEQTTTEVERSSEASGENSPEVSEETDEEAWEEFNRLLDDYLTSLENEEEASKEENQTAPVTVEQSVKDVLTQRFIAGYEAKDIALYESAFWADDFAYYSDVGTDNPDDDVFFTDFNIELGSENRVFNQFDDIKVQLSNIEFDPVPSDENIARVKAYYNLSLTSFKESQTYYPSGVMELTFKKRDGEWRISRWEDYPFPPEE